MPSKFEWNDVSDIWTFKPDGVVIRAKATFPRQVERVSEPLLAIPMRIHYNSLCLDASFRQ